jgi:hypothetical protein
MLFLASLFVFLFRFFYFKTESSLILQAPTIALHVNDPDLATDDYTRFLTARFRNEIPTLEGSPLSIVYKKSMGSESYQSMLDCFFFVVSFFARIVVAYSLEKTNKPVSPDAQRSKQSTRAPRTKPKFGEARTKRKVIVVNYMKKNQKKRKAENESRRQINERRDKKKSSTSTLKKNKSDNSKKHNAKKTF